MHVHGGSGGGRGEREAWNARRRDERVEMITRNAYTQGKDELAWDAWPNRLVLRLSGNETNNPLKSGPATAGPAGPAMPPLLSLLQ